MVISLLETTIIGVAEINADKEITVTLISIYDKADVGTITDKELKDLIKAFRSE